MNGAIWMWRFSSLNFALERQNRLPNSYPLCWRVACLSLAKYNITPAGEQVSSLLGVKGK